jgi:uncharacterized protein
MAEKTFWNIIEETIEAVRVPLTAKEIWEKANELGITNSFHTTGKTPWATIAAYCYTDIINNNKKSIIVKKSDRPVKFMLRRLDNNPNQLDFRLNSSHIPIESAENTSNNKPISQKEKFSERDLHPLVVSFANSYFKAHLKTIFHETSKRKSKGENKWLHPDLVGVYFPFTDFANETIDIQQHLSVNSVKLYSFEVKISLDFSNLREYYFQAVSNSSWANEGYIVVLNINDDGSGSLLEELRRLNNAFGIGIIQLNLDNINESKILFSSNINSNIDWQTVNRLTTENKNFEDFLKDISEDMKLKKVKSSYDVHYNHDEIQKYITDNKIKNHY